MSSSRHRSRLALLLQQLYDKKQWLDTMIAGIESASQSVDHQFIESVEKMLGDSRIKKPTVDLDERQRAKLARLALRVGRTGLRRRKHEGAATNLQQGAS